MKIDGNWATGSSKEKWLHEAKKEAFKHEAKEKYAKSDEHKRILHGSFAMGGMAFLIWCIICVIEKEYSLLWLGLVVGFFLALSWGGIMDSIGCANYTKRYVAQKEIEDLQDK